MSWDDRSTEFYTELDLFERMAQIMRKENVSEGLHTDAQMLNKKFAIQEAVK